MDRLDSAAATLVPQIRRWLRPPRILRPTRAGWIFVAILFGIGFAALNTGNNLLYLVLSLLLSFLILSGVLSESALRGIQVTRKLPREFFVGRDHSILLEVTNSQKRIAAYAVVVEDLLPAAVDGRDPVRTSRPSDARPGARENRRRRQNRAAGRCFFLRIGPGEQQSRRYSLSPTRRGPLGFSGFRVSTRFPFGLFLKYREFEAVDETLVYPKIVPRAHRAWTTNARAAAKPAGARAKPGAGENLSGLREFVPGDSMRRVHWRSTLRRGALLVAETEDDRKAEIEVRLGPAPLAPAGSDSAPAFEQSVSRAASEITAHLHTGAAVALRTNAVYLAAEAGERQRTRLLAFLARVRSDGRCCGEPIQ